MVLGSLWDSDIRVQDISISSSLRFSRLDGPSLLPLTAWSWHFKVLGSLVACSKRLVCSTHLGHQAPQNPAWSFDARTLQPRSPADFVGIQSALDINSDLGRQLPEAFIAKDFGYLLVASIMQWNSHSLTQFSSGCTLQMPIHTRFHAFGATLN